MMDRYKNVDKQLRSGASADWPVVGLFRNKIIYAGNSLTAAARAVEAEAANIGLTDETGAVLFSRGRFYPLHIAQWVGGLT